MHVCDCLYRPTTTTFHLLAIIKEKRFRQQDRQSSESPRAAASLPLRSPSPRRRLMEVYWARGMKWAGSRKTQISSKPALCLNVSASDSCVALKPVHVICHIMWEYGCLMHQGSGIISVIEGMAACSSFFGPLAPLHPFIMWVICFPSSSHPL